jgi:hypothetical protein
MTPGPTLDELLATVRTDAGSEEALDLLATAARTAQELTAVADALLGYHVEGCRREGRSWSEISEALGVTRQAAHKRFTPGPLPMDRFTMRAKASLEAATAAAKAMGHTFVGTEHLLLGLFEPAGTVAERILTTIGFTHLDVAKAVGRRTPKGAGAATEPPYTPKAADALAAAVTNALELGHNYIGTEHLLLGLFRHPDSVACEILTEGGATFDDCRARIVELLAGLA